MEVCLNKLMITLTTRGIKKKKNGIEVTQVALPGFDPGTSGLWALHASTASQRCRVSCSKSRVYPVILVYKHILQLRSQLASKTVVNEAPDIDRRFRIGLFFKKYMIVFVSFETGIVYYISVRS